MIARQRSTLKKILVLALTLALFSASFFSNGKLEFLCRPKTQTGNYAFVDFETVRVPEDHATIQSAINNASMGDTVTVKAGTYYENVIVNKTVRLIGENRDTTILDGRGKGTVFYVNYTDNVEITGFTLQNGYSGIWLWHSNNSTVSGNSINNNAYGIKLDYSENSKMNGNNIKNSQWFSIVLDHSGNSTLQNNSMTGDRFNLRVDGEELIDFINFIDTTNAVNGKPVYYLTNQRDITIDLSTFKEFGYLALINSTNVTVKDLNIKKSGQGILFAHTSNSILRNLTTTDNWNGIEAKAASNVTVIENNANNNFDFGIKFEHSRNSLVTQNNANNNGWAGIGIFTSQNVTVNANSVNNNINYGIDLVYSTDCAVRRNNVANGMAAYSMVLYYSNLNRIYHNNFVNHYIYKQVKITNTWDNGVEGNYWIRYNGTDVDQDGIADTPYTIEEGNQDNHPLMGRFSVFPATTENEITIISNSTISNFQFDLENKVISFSATDGNETFGFSRLRIPKALVISPYTILIDGRKLLTQKELSDSNETYTYVYLAYSHSTSETLFPEALILISVSLGIATMISVTVILLQRRKEAAPPTEALPSESQIPPSSEPEKQFIESNLVEQRTPEK